MKTCNLVVALTLSAALSQVGCIQYESTTGSAITNEEASMANDSTETKHEVSLTERGGDQENSDTKLATFGGGCFWCVEAVFQRLKGVTSVTSGYSGGHVENPTYEQVCAKITGHAEVCQIQYDPSKVAFEELLEVFWKTHDPTTLNRQGNDEGPQYRSVIFYHDENQKTIAENYRTKLNHSGIWPQPIVTEISPFTNFYNAENDHQNYFNLNPNQGYCQFVIVPKIEKLKQVFKDKLKDDE